jgi:hypothetical protein
MWTEEEITSRNSDQPRILNALLSSGCVTHEFLCEVAEELDGLPEPHVGCFGMLPFPLAVSSNDSFSVPTGRDGATATFRFEHFIATFDAGNRIRYETYHPTLDFEINGSGIGTQVICHITPWGRHIRNYSHYLACVGDHGLEGRSLISKSLWGRKRAPTGVDGHAMDSSRYEDELNGAIVLAFAYALSVFLDNYNVAALYNFTCPMPIPGVFTMPAPGRVSYRNPPIPPAASMFQCWLIKEIADASTLRAALKFGRRQFDRYQHQLLAMQSLSRDGEPELAVIGSVTAIEWFLNTLVDQNAPLPKWYDRNHRPSINRCLELPLNIVLSTELVGRLRVAADYRNKLAHGTSPSRSSVSDLPAEEMSTRVVRTGFALYKEVQMGLRVGLLE